MLWTCLGFIVALAVLCLMEEFNARKTAGAK